MITVAGRAGYNDTESKIDIGGTDRKKVTREIAGNPQSDGDIHMQDKRDKNFEGNHMISRTATHVKVGRSVNKRHIHWKTT